MTYFMFSTSLAEFVDFEDLDLRVSTKRVHGGWSRTQNSILTGPVTLTHELPS